MVNDNHVSGQSLCGYMYVESILIAQSTIRKQNAWKAFAIFRVIKGVWLLWPRNFTWFNSFTMV